MGLQASATYSVKTKPIVLTSNLFYGTIQQLVEAASPGES